MVRFGVRKGFLYRTAEEKLSCRFLCGDWSFVLTFLTLPITQDIWILSAIASRNLNLMVLPILSVLVSS